MSNISEYYAGLLIKQYQSQPNAESTIEALIDLLAMGNLPTLVLNAFNLTGPNIAVGAQLDILGKYAGVSRTGYSFNGTAITLDDADFLTFIQMAIIRNSSGSSLATIQALLHQYFPGEILVFDYQNMQMSFLISSSVGSQNLAQLFVTEGLLPKPMGVSMAVVYAPEIDEFFGFRTATLAGHNITGFNSAASYNLDSPWLSAANVITA
jgi:hypothetical protein